MYKRIGLLLLITCLLGSLATGAAATTGPGFTIDQQLPAAMQGIYYSVQFTATGQGSLNYALVIPQAEGHSFPKGMALTPEGQLYGTPQAAGQYSFEVTVTELASSLHTTAVFSLTVQGMATAQTAPSAAQPAAVNPHLGVANGPNGGRVAMYGDTIFYVTRTGYLLESTPPFTSSKKVYWEVEYACLDTLDSDLYYFNRRLVEKGQPGSTNFTNNTSIPSTPDKWINRIVRDSIHEKGLIALVQLRTRISSLSVVQEGVIYIREGQVFRADIKSGKVRPLDVFGLRISKVFPFKGQAYCLSERDGLVYRARLNGKAVEAFTQLPVRAFTVARRHGQDLLYFTDTSDQLYAMPLNGGPAVKVEGLKATALNADESHIYFSNALDGFKLYRLDPITEVAVRLTDLPAKSIYVFENHLALEEMGSENLFVLSKTGGEATQLKE